MYNKVMLIGRLVADPTVRYSQQGTPVATFTLAVDRPGQNTTDFIDLVCFGRNAEIASRYLYKGRLVFVEGMLQVRSFEGNDGSRRRVYEVRVDSFRMLDRPERGAEQAAEPGMQPGMRAVEPPQAGMQPGAQQSFGAQEPAPQAGTYSYSTRQAPRQHTSQQPSAATTAPQQARPRPTHQPKQTPQPMYEFPQQMEDLSFDDIDNMPF